MTQLLSAQQYDVAAGNLHLQSHIYDVYIYTHIYIRLCILYMQMRDFVVFSTLRQVIQKGPWNNTVYVFVLFAPAIALGLDITRLNWCPNLYV